MENISDKLISATITYTIIHAGEGSGGVCNYMHNHNLNVSVKTEEDVDLSGSGINNDSWQNSGNGCFRYNYPTRKHGTLCQFTSEINKLTRFFSDHMVSVEMTPNPCGFYVAAGEKIGYNGQMVVTSVTGNSTYKFIAEYKVNKV